ncbi:MAG: NHLP leader peptide family natural product precursor [Acidobacteria bacterium]|nr:NHLP leader peptide family natural product precursor [Acidobacteriota bacterium]MYN67500.1 NHLP leader peptide family natural product precursor [Acidobacteriota bacterium]
MAQEFQTVEEFHDYVRNKAVENEEFRARLLADPKAVMEAELDLSIPDDFTIEVHEDSATTAHLVLPPSAALAEEDMRTVAGGGGWCSPV